MATENSYIRVIDYPRNTPTKWIQDGELYLDTRGDLNIRLSKFLEELTEVNKIAQQAALSFPLPKTKKNNFILDRFDINALDPDPVPLDVEVINAGNRLQFTKLVVVDNRDTDLEFEVEIFGSGWIDLLKDVALNELTSIGSYEYTNVNVLATWADTTALAYPTLAHYGNFETPGETSRKDCRFWFNGTKLLKLALASIGYSFVSPFYEGSRGARYFFYLSRERWFSYTGKNDPYSVHCDINTPRALGGFFNLTLLDEVSDPFNLYDNFAAAPSQYFYPFNIQSPAFFNVRAVDLTFTLPPAGGGNLGRLVVAVSKNGIQLLQVFQRTASLTDTVTETLSFTVTDVNAQGGDRYGIWVGYVDADGGSGFYPFTWESGDVYFEPDRSFYVEDDNIPLYELIDPELSALDLLRSMVHLINGKIKTDYVKKEISLYPPLDVEVDDANVEGYFQFFKQPIDISDKVLERSRKVSVEETKQSRFLEFKFKNATDAYIKSQNLNEQPFSRRVDLGRGELKTQKIENPLIEPTVDIATTPAEVGTGLSQTPFLMAVWDNTDGNRSQEVNPRVGYCYGLVQQLNADTGTANRIIFDGVNRDTIGYISQVPSREFSSGEAVRIAYGDFSDDAYNLFYKRVLDLEFPRFSIEFLILVEYEDYLDWDFRRPFAFYYGGTYLTYLLKAIRDYNVGIETSTPLTFNLIPRL